MMNKEIEALKRIETTFSMNKQGKESVYREYTNSVYPYYEDFDLVLKALHRLESIDNSNPSEALKKLEMLSDCAEAMKEAPSSNWIEYADNETELDYQLWRAYEDLKSALLKAQEDKKKATCWDIVKEKQVDLGWLWYCIHECVNSLNEYNKKMPIDKFKLTEKEFNLLKEVL